METAAAPTAGLGALRPLLVLQLFAPARGRAASLDGCALPPLRKLPITGGLGADRRELPLGPPRRLGDASGALIRFHGDGLAGRLGVALVAPSAASKSPRRGGLGTRSRRGAASTTHKPSPRRGGQPFARGARLGPAQAKVRQPK